MSKPIKIKYIMPTSEPNWGTEEFVANYWRAVAQFLSRGPERITKNVEERTDGSSKEETKDQ